MYYSPNYNIRRPSMLKRLWAWWQWRQRQREEAREQERFDAAQALAVAESERFDRELREDVARMSGSLLAAFEPVQPEVLHVGAVEWQPISASVTEDGVWDPDTTQPPFDGGRYLLRTEMGAIVGRWVNEPGVTKDNNEYDGKEWLLLDDQCAFEPRDVFNWRSYDPAEWSERGQGD